MDINKLREPLAIDQLDFRVQSVNAGYYATLLAYKNARVDQQRLDSVVGPLNWKRRHVNENKNCIVSIWCEKKGEWVSKEDTGTESFADAEKGLASDSFKRACFNWGIGRELYSYPRIQVKLRDDEKAQKNGKPSCNWKFDPNSWVWFSQFDKGGALVYLAAKDLAGLRYSWGEYQNDSN